MKKIILLLIKNNGGSTDLLPLKILIFIIMSNSLGKNYIILKNCGVLVINGNYGGKKELHDSYTKDMKKIHSF